MTLSTHILDATTGRPAAGMTVHVEAFDDDLGWTRKHAGETGTDGRLRLDGRHGPGRYRFTFLTGRYFAERGMTAFYPEVTVAFIVREAGEHCHVPLLLSPYAYSTYRGS